MNEMAASIRAFVLCGGLGTRLRSVLSDRPKSMASVAGRPFLELILRQLHGQGIRKVILGTGYRAEQIEQYFQTGADLGLSIEYSREAEPLGTGGAAKLAEKFLSDPVVVVNGDSYVEWNLSEALALQAQRNAKAVIVLQAVPDVSRYGSVTIDDEGRITEFVEKRARTGSGLINAGVYLLQKEVLAELPAGRAISLEREVFPRLLGRPIYGMVSRGIFIDIGIPQDLARAQTLLGPDRRT
jgi:D-glycero-alpha-D-manno-heptose 1-phosphate guanylyltransferase